MANYRILALDGGGLHGILTARLLVHLEAMVPRFLSQADLYAGTSTGAILGVAFAMGRTPEEMVALYQDQGPLIFHKDLLTELGDLWGLTGAKYSTQNRYDALLQTFGTGTLGEIANNVLVASFDLDSANEAQSTNPPSTRSWKAKFFHNFPDDNNGKPNPDVAVRAIDVIMRSSAAPTYFPIYEGYVDGGVVANNPSLCALTQALNINTGKQQLSDLRLLSIGTGLNPEYVTSQDGNWGLTQWNVKLIDLLLESGSGLADYQCSQLLGDSCYKRLQPILQQNIGLDEIDAMPGFVAQADEMAASGQLAPIADWIQANW